MTARWRHLLADAHPPASSAQGHRRSHFETRVLATVRRIPRGQVATYGQVAALAGRPEAARAVGNIMRRCQSPDVPCHRVIAAGGRLGGYGGSPLHKRALLAAEGVRIVGQRVRLLSDGTSGTGRARRKV